MVFRLAIADGFTTTVAAQFAGVSEPVGVRWFRNGGRMPDVTFAPLSGRFLSFLEREEIALLRAQGVGVREIARRLGRAPSTVSRELSQRGDACGKLDYRPLVAQWKAEMKARRPKVAKLAADPRLYDYVQRRLAGEVRRPDGTVAGPRTPAWNGRNKPRRKDGRWETAWSPEQISARLRIEFPDDPSMRISHEAIYQALFIQSRGAQARVGGLSLHRPGTPGAQGTGRGARQAVRDHTGNDQRSAR